MSADIMAATHAAGATRSSATTAMLDAAVSEAAHPFLTHLVALLSVFELPPMMATNHHHAADEPGAPGATVSHGRTPGLPPPRYDGPRTAQTDAIERSIDVLANRMKSAEELLGWTHPWYTTTDNDRNPYHKDSEDDSTPTTVGSGLTPRHDLKGEIDPFSKITLQAPTPVHSGDISPASHTDGNGDITQVRHARAPSPMSISLQGLSNQHLQRPSAVSTTSPNMIDPKSPSYPSPYICPGCRRPLASRSTSQSFTSTHPILPSPNGSPLVVPPGPLSTAAFESGLSAVEELRLLKAQVQDVARVCKAVANGDLTQKIEVGVQGPVMVQLKDVINTMVDKLGQFAKEVTRVSLEVGTEGRLGGQAVVVGVQGTWQELTDVVNRLAANLSTQVRSIAIVTTAVARGDLSQMIEVDAKGEILALKNTVNSMVLRLRALAAEVTRVTLEVGSQGKLGGSAVVADVEGVWADLTINVNRMCYNLTNQVRSIAAVTTAVAEGDLSKSVEIEVEGEIATLKDTVNSMVSQLRTFAAEVTRVALEVGTEGILGGQANVEGAQG
ncbi:hypothetical protein FRC17_000839, partial [Serendipita sp. 399]